MKRRGGSDPKVSILDEPTGLGSPLGKPGLRRRRIRLTWWSLGVMTLSFVLLSIRQVPSPFGGVGFLVGMVLLAIAVIGGTRSKLAAIRADARALSAADDSAEGAISIPRRGLGSPRRRKTALSGGIWFFWLGFPIWMFGVFLIFISEYQVYGYWMGGFGLLYSSVGSYIILRDDRPKPPGTGRVRRTYLSEKKGAPLPDSGELISRPEGDEFDIRGVDLLGREAPAESSVVDAVSALMSRQIAAVTSGSSSGLGSVSTPVSGERASVPMQALHLSERTRDRVAATEVLFLIEPEGQNVHRVAVVPHAAVSSWVQDVIDRWVTPSGGAVADSGAARWQRVAPIPRQYAAMDVAKSIQEAEGSRDDESGAGLSQSVTVRVLVTQGMLIATDIWIGDQPGQKLFSPDIPQDCVDALSQA